MVERCPDKTEADGPIPSTLTMIFDFFSNKRSEEPSLVINQKEIIKIQMEKFGADETCRKLMEELEASLVMMRKEPENVVELGQLRRIVNECLKFEDIEFNRLATKKGELRTRALELKEEFHFI